MPLRSIIDVGDTDAPVGMGARSSLTDPITATLSIMEALVPKVSFAAAPPTGLSVACSNQTTSARW